MWHCHEKCCCWTGPWAVFSAGCEVLGTSCSKLPKQHPLPKITQPGCNPSLGSFTTGAHSLSELVPFWQGNNLILSNICCVASFFFPLFKETFLILQRKPTWYNGCQDLIQTTPSRKYLQVKDPFITLPLPLNACHIECGLCLLLSSSLYAESSLDFAKFKSWAESVFSHQALGARCLSSLELA